MPSPRAQRRRQLLVVAAVRGHSTAQLRSLAMGFVVATLAVTVFLPQPVPLQRWPVAALTVAAIAIIWAIRTGPIGRVWDDAAPLVAALYVAGLVAVTGGAESIYADLFAVMLIIRALVCTPRQLALTVGIVACAAGAPALYEPVPDSFVTDLVADVLTWAGIAFVTHVQSENLRLRARELQAQHAQLQQRVEREHRVLEELHQLDVQRQTMLRSLNHEIRTPLTILLGFAELIATHDGDPTIVSKLSEPLLRHARRLTDLVETVGGLVDRDEATFAPVDIDTIVRDAVRGARLGARAVAVDVTVGEAVCDADALQVALRQLLDNASRYAPGAAIAVRADVAGDQIRLTVADDGPGWQVSDPQRLAEPFSQGPPAAASSSPGAGLGLALVEQFARTHGGWIRLGVAPSGGASVTVVWAREPNPLVSPPTLVVLDEPVDAQAERV